jgi:hypothetical protein
MGLRPGAAIVVKAGVRSASLLVRIDGRPESARLSHKLASFVSVVSAAEGRATLNPEA